MCVIPGSGLPTRPPCPGRSAIDHRIVVSVLFTNVTEPPPNGDAPDADSHSSDVEGLNLAPPSASDSSERDLPTCDLVENSEPDELIDLSLSTEIFPKTPSDVSSLADRQKA